MITKIQSETGESIRAISRTLSLPRSSHYHAGKPTKRALEDHRLGELIETIFREHRRRYGYRRIHQELKDHNIKCSPERVRRIMKARNLRALSRRRFTPKTSDGKAPVPAPNLLKERAQPVRPNEVWTGDITYLPSANGWLYLAIVIDLYSRRIIGWYVADHMRTELVLTALNQAIETRSRTSGSQPIFHSDRGSQYGSTSLRETLQRANIDQSMSAKANPYDNAWTESFMGTLKTELLSDGQFETIADARATLFEYIEAYYNTKRKHSSLGYRTPHQAELNSQFLTLPLLTN